MAKVVALVPDLLFGSRVVSRLTAGGHEASLAADEDALRAWLAEGHAGPRAIVADLTAEAPSRVELIGRLRAEGLLDGVRLVAFYSHVESDVRTLAEEASFDLIVARSRYAREGAALVTRLVDADAPAEPAPAEPAPAATPARRPGGRVALITGASSGIGEATARRLARDGGWTLVLVARREERLQALASELGGASVLAVDLTEDDAPARVRELLEREHGGRLDLLVNNAGAGWGGSFATNGYAEVRRTMALNFDAVVRLSEELLPLLRASAPSSLVNVASTAGRVGRAKSGAYSASKFALAGWTDSLHLEEKRNGVHVGLVLPGFVATEGFPQRALVDRPHTRWLVSTADKVADAIVDAGPGGKAERYVPRPYALAAALRVVAPGLVRWALSR
ncbi:SDR family NAD(P)-dependent oxidoreductase [Conexibacter sp. JD483]|uniref:SDR family NAD(P)-dependent oxidoreductase n=1 Tax=unclassified Conexibacter TaxID=2627773 RepID=UPI002717FA85|nr:MULTISPECIES: SDR family NAD(P)-dependent oxidoreductase [unclassified Conexibacter]MDO8187170.1 SDR family NAD(P)-dependent oxidoreductase [Conexibacter sp. CPCC 205706]MDO8200346.1 SDR family NAD(P)-dependent oxidoreductase [Conexibacter sp. CPCC 205762]MDR9368858.1 SDR family NAD(P)-dependent oxidoreductase [Conexibacter sp. JD483]